MDLTYLYRELSRKNQEELGEFGQSPVRELDEQQSPDKLTQECLEIARQIKQLQTNLITLRPLYLSTTKATSLNNVMTDKQRDELDYETRLVLQQQAAKIRQLEALEKQRLEVTSRRHKNPLAKLMADPKVEGASLTLNLHRRGMFWYLTNLLKEVSQMYTSQQEIRLSRRVEMAKNSVHISTPTFMAAQPRFGDDIDNDHHLNDDDKPSELLASLTTEQTLELEQESNALLEELQVTHDKVKNAHKSMQEISELQTNLSMHLATQNDKIESLINDAFQTQVDISAANKQLSSARQRNRKASKIIVYSSVTIGVILLVYDAMLG